MQVNQGGFEVAVTQKPLDIKDIGARLQKMRSKGMTQAMDVASSHVAYP